MGLGHLYRAPLVLSFVPGRAIIAHAFWRTGVLACWRQSSASASSAPSAVYLIRAKINRRVRRGTECSNAVVRDQHTMTHSDFWPALTHRPPCDKLSTSNSLRKI